MKCPGDGTGRHARLKIWWLQGRMGSSPIPGTFKKYNKIRYKNLIFFILLNKKSFAFLNYMYTY